MVEVCTPIKPTLDSLFAVGHRYRQTKPLRIHTMCITCMSSRTHVLASSLASSISSIHNSGCSSCSNNSSSGGGMCFPATKAVNRLILGDQETTSTLSDYQYKDIEAHESLVAVPWPRLIGRDAAAEFRLRCDDVAANNENLHSSTIIRGSFQEDGLRKYSDIEPGPLSFPVIEWCSTEDEVDDDDDSGDTEGSGHTTVSAPARIGGSHIKSRALKRGSLVRSISLVSRIMEEMNDTTTALKRTKKLASFNVQQKQRQFKGLVKV